MASRNQIQQRNGQCVIGLRGNLEPTGTPLLPIEFDDLPKLFAPIEPAHYFQRKIFRPVS
jgi:hypothetical protein